MMKATARVVRGLTVLTRAAGRPGKGRGQGRAGTNGRDRRYKKSIGPRGRRRNSRESARKIEEGWGGRRRQSLRSAGAGCIQAYILSPVPVVEL